MSGSHRSKPGHARALGPYVMIRPLDAAPVLCGDMPVERWIALDERDETNRTIYCFAPTRDTAERRRTLAALEAAASLRGPHITPIERICFAPDGRPHAVTPYMGNQEGLVTLPDLVEAKGGRLTPIEVERTLEQLLSAVATAHEQGHHHGPLAASQVLVDRHGSLWIETYGLARRFAGLGPADAELVRDEVRSIAAIGYETLTGLSADEPRLAPSRLVKRLSKAWDAWFDEAMDPFGSLTTAQDALAALPSRGGVIEVERTATRPMLRRLRISGAGRWSADRTA